jgi:hypothetical protein
MAFSRGVRRAGGTYGAIGAIRRGFRLPSSAVADDDLSAVRRGELRAVSCFLRGSYDPYPRRSRQGIAVVGYSSVAWRPSWGLRRPVRELSEPIRKVRVRMADASDTNLKKGGTAFGVLQVPAFQVVVCTTDRGTLEFGVPTADVTLMESCLRQR